MPPRPTTSFRALTSTRFATTSALPSSTSILSSIPSSTSSPSSSSSKSTKPTSDPNRIYTARKTFLWNYYTHLIENSSLVLVFDHSNLTSSEWSKIRRSIDSIPLPSKPFNPSSSPSSSQEPKETIEKASLNVVRTGVLHSLLSSTQFSNLPPLNQSLIGQRALLTCSTLSPTYLNKILNNINRTIKSLKRENTKDEKQPSLKLISGLLEGKSLFNEKQLRDEISKLPELDILRSQLVGLLESQPRTLLGLLGQARGGSLVRTLQGLEESLKGPEGGEGGEEQKSA